MPYETILLERDSTDKFAILTLNRPERLNAMNKTTIREIAAAAKECSEDPEINALLIRGAGRAFSSGYDLGGGDFDVDVDFWRDDMKENAEAWLELWNASIPTVAAVHGYALAGALELMMCCDLAIAASDAKFGEPEVRHNSGPPTLMMPWLLPTRDVRYLMYTGDLVSADEALRMHLVNKVVAPDQLEAESLKLVRKLARMPTPAIRYAKYSINQQQMLAGLGNSFTYNIESMAALHTTKAGREWMAKLAKMSLKEYLTVRDAPFKDLE